MFTRIIVGVDEHHGGRDAIALATALLSADGELTLAHVDASDPYVYRGVSALYETRERELALMRLGEAATGMRTEPSLQAISSTSVGRGLHELAEQSGADLLVVGSSRRGLAGRALLGDDTHAALNGASCGVAVAPTGYGSAPAVIREIGVGYDASPESERALELARELAAERGARLSAFQAVSVPAYVLGAGAASIDASIDDVVAEARKRIALLDGVEPHAAYGSPAEELTLFSASVDLLVIGSRGYGPIGRIVHGSVSLRLARSARCPLLVLPRAARHEPITG
jgi:nucleotide-binding universal stress UspA family protein